MMDYIATEDSTGAVVAKWRSETPPKSPSGYSVESVESVDDYTIDTAVDWWP